MEWLEVIIIIIIQVVLYTRSHQCRVKRCSLLLAVWNIGGNASFGRDAMLLCWWSSCTVATVSTVTHKPQIMSSQRSITF